MKLSFGLLLAMAAAAAGDDADGGDDANEGNDADDAGDDADDAGDDADDAGDDADDAGDDANDGYNANANANAKESSSAANSIRDKSFYRPGFVNPALNNPLYHDSARSVLENLGNFETLYVKYENCAWAQYGQEYSEHRGGEDDENGFGYGEQVLGCGAGRGGDEYWYMGSTECFRAQAAFSLYGIPKGQSGRKSGSQCHKATYINSFFTTLGVEALASPLGVDTTYGNSYCTVYPPSYGGDDDGGQDDDNYDPGHVEKYDFAGYTSAGIGCQRNRFVQNTYGGAFCDGNDYNKTTDTLDSFNKALDNLDCVQIYDSSSGYYYEDDDNGDENDVDFTALDNSVDLLKFSAACDVDEYPGSCPDPYGLLRKYNKMLQGALTKENILSKNPGEIVMNTLTGVLFFLSLLMGVTIIRKRRRLASKNGLKKKEKSTPPPPSADDVSVVSSSTSSSVASSDRSITNEGDEVDEETPYQAHEVTKETSFVGSIVSSVAAYFSSTLPNASPEHPIDDGETPYQAHYVTKQPSFALSVANAIVSNTPEASSDDRYAEVIHHKMPSKKDTTGMEDTSTVAPETPKKKMSTAKAKA